MLANHRPPHHRCIDDSKRRHGIDEDAGDTITSTPISKRKRTISDDVTLPSPSDSKTPPQDEDKSDDGGKSANMSPSTSSTSSSFDEGNSTDISQTSSSSSSVSVSPFRHSSNEDEDKMRAGSPDSGIEATASPYSTSDSSFMMYNFTSVSKKKERLSSSSQEVMSNSDSCVPLDSTPTSPEDNSSSVDNSNHKESTSDSEQQKSSTDLPVAAYRLCLERPPEPPKPKPAEPSVVCYWDGCEQIFFEGSQLQDHLQEEHVKSATEESKWSCRWRGCRVYDKPTRNSSCLHQHVVSHSGCKRFPCCFEGCSARFQTSAGLERHVSSHLKKVKGAGQRSKSSNHSSSYGGGGGPLGVRRRYKDQMMPLANRYDCMDAYTMEKISYRLRLLKRFEEKRSTRRRHIPPTTAATSSSSSVTSQSPSTSTLDCSASSVAATSSSSSSDAGASSVQDEQASSSSGGESSAICELFRTPSTAPPSRTELEDILFFNRPQKRRRKNKREAYGPQLFGGPNY